MSDTIFINSVSFVTSSMQGNTLDNQLKPNDDANWFDASHYLGRKGHRYYSTAVKYLLAAATFCEPTSDYTPEESGVFVGTESVDLPTRRSVCENLKTNEAPSIGAASAPNCSVNVAAAKLAQQLQCKGPCFTFTGREDASFMALWQALQQLSTNVIKRALVAQVEHDSNDEKRSGTILWDISSNRNGSSNSISISKISRGRWANNLNYTPEINLPPKEEPVYIIGKNNPITTKLKRYFDKNTINFTNIWYDSIEETTCKSMQLYSTLSLIILKRLSGNFFIVSSTGHIFHLKLKT